MHRRVPVRSCVGEGSVEFIADRGVPFGSGFEYRVTLGFEDEDDRVPPCATELGLSSGYDAAVVFVPPSSGTWLLDTSRRGTNIGAWVSIGTSCLEEDQLACSGTNGVVNRGALLVELDEGVPYSISLDASPGAQGVVLLELFPVQEVVGEGDECTPGTFDLFCDIGFDCLQGRCFAREGEFAELGEACGVGDTGVVPCAVGLECVDGVCAVTEGTTCADAVDLNAIGEVVEGGLRATSLTLGRRASRAHAGRLALPAGGSAIHPRLLPGSTWRRARVTVSPSSSWRSTTLVARASTSSLRQHTIWYRARRTDGERIDTCGGFCLSGE